MGQVNAQIEIVGAGVGIEQKLFARIAVQRDQALRQRQRFGYDRAAADDCPKDQTRNQRAHEDLPLAGVRQSRGIMGSA